MILQVERIGGHIVIKLMCNECGDLLREDFNGAHSARLICKRCGYVLEADRAIEFIETVQETIQSEVCMLLETLREAALGQARSSDTG